MKLINHVIIILGIYFPYEEKGQTRIVPSPPKKERSRSVKWSVDDSLKVTTYFSKYLGEDSKRLPCKFRV